MTTLDSQWSASASRHPVLARRRNSVADRAPSPETVVVETEAYDVILGRGRSHQYHPGNKRYQALITKNYDRYFNAELHDKKKISSQIVEAVMQRGRFLKKHKHCWVTISTEQARIKCAHALQYHHRRPSLTSSSVSGSESDSDDLSQSAPTQKDNSVTTHHEKADPVRRHSAGLNSLTFQLLAGSPLNLSGSPPDYSRQATPSNESNAEDALSSSSSQDNFLDELLSNDAFDDVEQEYLESIMTEGPAFTSDWHPFWNP